MSELTEARRLSFGAAAERYDRARPSYPDALIDDLLAPQPRSVLDVGAGTGKVSELLVARGLEVMAIEPDERMAAVTRAKGIIVAVSPFEAWDAGGRTFDLVTAGQSWHWVQQPDGSSKAHDVLRAHGHLAAFWNIGAHEERTLAALDPVYKQLAPSIAESATALRQTVDEEERVGYTSALTTAGFMQPEARAFPWTKTYSSAEWVDYIGTHSDHRTLSPRDMDALLDAVGGAVDSIGGTLVYHFTTVLLLAERP